LGSIQEDSNFFTKGQDAQTKNSQSAQPKARIPYRQRELDWIIRSQPKARIPHRQRELG
jgi:hypothetical protein